MPNYIKKFLDFKINPIEYGKASVKPLERPRHEKPSLSNLTRKPKARKVEARKPTKPGETRVTSIRMNGGRSYGPALIN